MTTGEGYKINPQEWIKMTDEDNILEIISAFVLEHHDIIDDDKLIEESETVREILRMQKKERDEDEAEYEEERKRVKEAGGN